jgi:hypothetical protein
MKNYLSLTWVALLILCSCHKEITTPAGSTTGDTEKDSVVVVPDFVEYSIYKGQQYCDKSTYKPIDLTELKFVVKFDSTAIYSNVNPVNQTDINKLYGFSDNNATHQEFSARFGWRWSDKALWLFAYIYNNGVRYSKKLGSVAIGSENYCSIKVKDSTYIFTLNNIVDTLERKSTTEHAEGYQLYPYFGGDETAPHDIHIWIKDVL